MPRHDIIDYAITPYAIFCFLLLFAIDLLSRHAEMLPMLCHCCATMRLLMSFHCRRLLPSPPFAAADAASFAAGCFFRRHAYD